MMKKTIAALCLCLLLLCASAMAENMPVFRLYGFRADDSAVNLGIGVLCGDGSTILTANNSVNAYSDVAAVSANGPVMVDHAMFLGESGLALLYLHEDYGMEPMPLAQHTDYCYCLGVDGSMNEVRLMPEEIQATLYHGLPAMEITVDADMLPGALLTDDDQLFGMVVARCAEGEHRYIVLDCAVIRQQISASLGTEEGAAQKPEGLLVGGVECSQDGCVLTVDWSGVDLTGASPDAKIWVMVEDENNIYFSYGSSDLSDGMDQFVVVPGRSYLVWVYVGQERPSVNRNTITAKVKMTESAPYAEYSYLDTQFYFSLTNGEVVDAEHLAPRTPAVTDAQLKNAEHVWTQVVSTYQVEAEVDLDGCVALFAPNGSSYVEFVSFLLMPEMNEGDVWAFPMDGIRKTYLSVNEFFQPGEYTIRYYFADAPVTECTFTVE